MLFILLLSLQQLYDEGKYFLVIDKAESTLKDTTLSVEDKVGLHTILAFTYVALNKTKLAKLEFMEAILLKPDLELDPILTSPKIMEIFLDAKNSIRFLKKEEAKFVIKKDFYSFVIPGIYEIKKEKKKGKILLYSYCVSGIATFISIYLCKKYHNEYLNAREQKEIDEKYNKYKIWFNIRNFSFTLLTTTYIINLFLLF